jgi:hypothetical protein
MSFSVDVFLVVATFTLLTILSSIMGSVDFIGNLVIAFGLVILRRLSEMRR